jgi:hypothetical protein
MPIAGLVDYAREITCLIHRIASFSRELGPPWIDAHRPRAAASVSVLIDGEQFCRRLTALQPVVERGQIIVLGID